MARLGEDFFFILFIFVDHLNSISPSSSDNYFTNTQAPSLIHCYDDLPGATKTISYGNECIAGGAGCIKNNCPDGTVDNPGGN